MAVAAAPLAMLDCPMAVALSPMAMAPAPHAWAKGPVAVASAPLCGSPPVLLRPQTSCAAAFFGGSVNPVTPTAAASTSADRAAGEGAGRQEASPRGQALQVSGLRFASRLHGPLKFPCCRVKLPDWDPGTGQVSGRIYEFCTREFV